jgi:hypothetical protein
VVQTGDLVDFYMGRRAGRHRIVPGLSPKTWEGAGWGVAGSGFGSGKSCGAGSGIGAAGGTGSGAETGSGSGSGSGTVGGAGIGSGATADSGDGFATGFACGASATGSEATRSAIPSSSFEEDRVSRSRNLRKNAMPVPYRARPPGKSPTPRGMLSGRLPAARTAAKGGP